MVEPGVLLEGCPPLTTYYVYLTAGCNLACQHCWLAPKFQHDGGTGGHLNYDLFELAIEEGLPLGLSHVKLTGGEPLLHPDFVRMVDLLKAKNLGLTIETNGTLLTRELAQYLKDNSTLRHISVSIDGATAETHDAFRGVNGSFEKACNAVHYLAEVGYHPQVIMSLHKNNTDEIEPLVQLAKEMGAESIKFNLIQPSGRGELMVERAQSLDIQSQIQLGRWVERELQKQVSIRLVYSWPPAFQSMTRLLYDAPDTCGIFGILGILHSGHLAMCGIGTQIPELCYGLLGVDRVSDVWANHPVISELRKQIPEGLDGVCSRCIFQRRCLGYCIAENYHLSKKLTASFWFCEAAEEAGLFPVSRLRS